jgi:hypothetical protein
MKINIAHVGSDEWFNFKSEIIYGLFHSCSALGHDVIITHNQLDKSRLNILIGADWLAKPEYIQFIKENNLDYFIYEVEAVAGGTINYRNGFDMNSYLEIIDRARLIFTPYRFNQKAYEDLGYERKTVYTKWGYYSEVVDLNIRRDLSRDYLGVFFGLLKGVRKDKLELLQANMPGKIAVIGRNQPHLMRAYYLSKSEYALSLSYGEAEHFINPFRLQYLASNGIPVISDSINDQDHYLNLTIKVGDGSVEQALKQKPMDLNKLIEISKSEKLIDQIRPIFN